MKLYQDTNLVRNFQHNYFKQNNKTYTNKIDIGNEFNHIFMKRPNLAESAPCTIANNLLNFSKTRIKMVSDLQKYKRNPYHK